MLRLSNAAIKAFGALCIDQMKPVSRRWMGALLAFFTWANAAANADGNGLGFAIKIHAIRVNHAVRIGDMTPQSNG